MRLRVLVVDDAPAVAALHGRFVAAHARCELIGTAVSGPDAVAAVRAMAPDLVLLDVHLPGFSGLDALRVIRADNAIPQPDVIAVTAARDIGTVRDARMMGARHYLVKPFSVRDLHARIDDVIAERSHTDHRNEPLDQSGVDALMARSGRHPLPKGLSTETRDIVKAGLIERGSASAAELADDIGLSRVSCRRYLEHLADEGSARRTMDYATAGRPSTRYIAVP